MIVQNAFPEVIDALSTTQKYIYWVPGSATTPTVHADLTILAIVGNLVALDNTNREFTFSNTKARSHNEMDVAYNNIVYGVVTNVEAGLVMVGYDYDNSIRATYNYARILSYMRDLMTSMHAGQLKPNQVGIDSSPNGISYNFALLIYFAHAQYHAIHDREGYYSSLHVVPEPGRSQMIMRMAEQGVDFTDPTVVPIIKHSNTVENTKLAINDYKAFPDFASTEVKNDQGFDFSFSRLPREPIMPKNVTAPPTPIANHPTEMASQNDSPEVSADENVPSQEPKLIQLPVWMTEFIK